MKYIPAIILAALSLLFLLASIPTRGGVNANAILIVPAGTFAVLAAIGALIAWVA